MSTKMLKLLSIGMAVLVLSCNETKKEEAKEAGVPVTDSTASTKVNPEPVFQPFDIVEIAQDDLFAADLNQSARNRHHPDTSVSVKQIDFLVDRRCTHPELLDKTGHNLALQTAAHKVEARKAAQDRPTRWIGECGKGAVEGLWGWHRGEYIQPYG